MNNRFVFFLILKDWIKRRIFRQSTSIRGTWETTPGGFENMVEFLNWFDTTSSVEDTIAAAQRDWHYRFASHVHFEKVAKKRSLEIGFGGGRLVAQAAKSFDEAVGVDIHQAFDNTKCFLALQNCENYRLVHRNDIESLKDGSVDFVYSFIVFQHFDSVEEVDFYLSQIERLLSDEGISHIYYGKSKDTDIQVTDDKNFVLRDCSLFVAPEAMKDLVGKRFEVLEYQDNLPKNPETRLGESGQARIVFRKKY